MCNQLILNPKLYKIMIFYPRVKSQLWLLAGRLLLVMKLSVFLTLITVLQVTAASKAQTVTLTVKNRPLTQVMEEIKKQSGYHFFLQGEDLAHVLINASYASNHACV